MKVLCRLLGHKRFRVTVVDAYDGLRYYSHPNGTRVACRRCHQVLPRSEGRPAELARASRS